MPKIKSSEELTIVGIKDEIARLNKEIESLTNKIVDMEKNYNRLPTKEKIIDFTERMQMYETRLDWFKDQMDHFRMLYEHLKNPVYEMMKMVNGIKQYLKRERIAGRK